MGSVNKVIVIGRLGKDPELRFTPGGQPVANFTLATNERWTDKSTGQPQERTEWHRIVVWGKQAEHCGQYLKKGRETYVEGRLQTREWTDKEGKKNYTTEIVANNVVFLGARDGGPGRDDYASGPDYDHGAPGPMSGGSGPMGGGSGPMGGGSGPMGEDDIPF